MSWSDKGGGGGSCYNCHQLGLQESSFGTVGPSLHQFAKKRGYGADIQRYAYGKIYNAKAYNLCTQMPRFGHVRALTEQQMRDLTALLMWDEWLPIRCRHSMISLEVTVPIYPKARNKAL